MSLPLFEEMRRASADWYTVNPLETLTEEQLTNLADQVGMTVEELRQRMTTPHVEATCPLCGRPQTHLVGCKGCGGNAWGWEWVEAHGEGFADQLRRRLREFLVKADGITQAQVHHAIKHAYVMGGCMVCTGCWHNTLPHDADLTCPLNLVSERMLSPFRLPQGAVMAMIVQETPEGWYQAVERWANEVWDRWVKVWNTVPEGPEREAVATWRAGLLCAALAKSPPGDGN